MISRHSRSSNYYRRPFYKTRGFKFLIFLIIFTSAFVYWSIKKIPPPSPTPPTAESTAGQAAQPTHSLVAAQIIFLDGAAEVKISGLPAGQAGTTNWEPLNLNYEIKQGDTVRTSGAAKSVIQLPDKSFVRMDANTEIFLKQLSLSDATLEQTYGHAFHRVNDNTPIIYKVLHGQTELIALGTAFDVAILGQTVEISAIANETKIKIYNALDNSLLNIDTVNQGEKAIINPALEKEKMIQKKTLTQNDLLNDTWFTWNKSLDVQNNYFLGMLGDLIDLTIAQTDLTTNDQEFIINGTTDKAATVSINNNKVENKAGAFEYKLSLQPGINKIQILAQKNKFENKKTLNITYEAKETITTDAKITLTAQQENGSIKLEWATNGITNPAAFITLVGKNQDVTFPAAPSHVVSGSATTDIWKGLEKAAYFVRVCLKQGDGCGIYSNEIILTP
ncbi:FecR domain-containing protein [Candidatus Falkowbacteria bacterium]|nr:FecR domain-containing protein [Candidatus Falkowbacteria bacterium]